MTAAFRTNLIFNMQSCRTGFNHRFHGARHVKGRRTKTDIRIHQQRQRTNVGDTANVGQHIIKGRNTEIRQPQRTCRHATARKINCLISGTLRQQRMISVDGANNLQWIFFSQCSAKRFTWRV